MQLRVQHIKSTLKLEKHKLNNNYNAKTNRKHIDTCSNKLEKIKYQNTNLNKKINATKQDKFEKKNYINYENNDFEKILPQKMAQLLLK